MAKKYDLRSNSDKLSDDEREFINSLNEKECKDNEKMDTVQAILLSLQELTAAVKQNQKDIENLTNMVAIDRQDVQDESPKNPGLEINQPNEVAKAGESISNVNTNRQSVETETRHFQVSAKIYDLPSFSGTPEEWPLFISNFDDTTEEFQYNNRQNLIRLQKCLNGEAKEAVEAMLIYPDDVPKVIDELKFRFGRPEILIRSQLAKIREFPKISYNKLDQVINLSTKVRCVVAFLSSAKCSQHLENPTLLEELISKLPTDTQMDWLRHVDSLESQPSIADFSTWLSSFARVISRLPQVESKPNYQKSPKTMLIANRVEMECPLCHSGHPIAQCKIWNENMDVGTRWDTAKSNRLCFACLTKGHNVQNCQAKAKCNVDGCSRIHHQSLHHMQVQTNTINEQKPNEVKPNAMLTCNANMDPKSQLFKVLPIVLYGPNGKVETFAMFDEGSAITLIEEQTSEMLGLMGREHQLNLQWYDNKVVTEKSKRVNFEISDSKDSVRYRLKDVYTVKKLNLPIQSFSKSEFKNLTNVPISEYENAKPVLLIGLDNAYLGLSKFVVGNGVSQPIAIQTKLGWLAYGPTSNRSGTLTVMHIKLEKIDDLHELVKEYFSSEDFGINDLPILESDDDLRAKQILLETTVQNDNHFQIGLLWKENVQLPNSFDMAKRRLISIEKKMNSNKEFAERYKREINKYLDKGYARILSPDEILDGSKRIWYLPHFAIQTVHKPDKLRIVFDAAATVEGVSLNSSLLKGPEQTNPLIEILLQFRKGAFGVAADIREMFSQIKIQPADQSAQRFIWRDGDATRPLQHFAMTSLIFGAVCSPYCAEYIKNRNAENFRDELPEAVDAIVKHHYVDDLVKSFDTEENAIKICKDIVHIHSQGGFELRNFVSNSAQIEKEMNGTSSCEKLLNMESQSSTEKILGMYWNTKEDSFEFKTKFHRISTDVIQGNRVPTKRELLGIVMAIFDPFGLITDFHIFARIMIQKTWSYQMEWDDILPLELHNEWICWWTALQEMHNFRMPRCYLANLTRSHSVQLHIFVDASQSAFAAVAYFRMAINETVHIAFVMGKARLAPKKLLSIPRLELQAAVLGVRINNLIKKHQKLQIHETIYWSDSRTVLQWIHSQKRKFKPYVGHRIAEILAATSPKQWKWISSSENTADAATRQVSNLQISHESPWLCGPPFLKMPQEDWPQVVQEIPAEPLEEEIVSKIILKCQVSNLFIDITRFSSLLKLTRAVAWVIRAKITFLHHIRKDGSKMHGPISSAEIAEAEAVLFLGVQQETFSEEIYKLKKGEPIEKSSNIYKMSPYIDEDGLLRLSGRIDEADCLPLSARRPILLPKNHPLSTLVLQYFHTKFHHQNVNVIINECRQRFWIPDAKGLLRRIQRSCSQCIIDRSKPANPIMGQLPVDRLIPYVRPFTYCGVDLFGPLNVSVGRRREKRWAVIFTCLTIRATHLEIAENLSTDAFIVCLRNFVNRRGVPSVIRCDNGTNFIGAQRELAAHENLLNADALINETSHHRIKWIFNCPLNPSAGGCWERLIRIVKRLLAKTLRDIAPRVETLRAALIEAENILNSRPLTELPLAHEDDEPLTPNHFLLGCANSTQTPHPPENTICLRKQWRIAQSLKDRLWKRWITEYLPQLICRSKWHKFTKPIQIDDLVLVMDESASRDKWIRGRVVKLYTAKDKQIRSVDIKTSSTILRRPVSKLIILNLSGESYEDSPGGGM